jgi:hypothetical protein
MQVRIWCKNSNRKLGTMAVTWYLFLSITVGDGRYHRMNERATKKSGGRPARLGLGPMTSIQLVFGLRFTLYL